MIPPVEFSRPQRLDTIGAGETTVTVTAETPEREALARRFGLIDITRIEARYTLRRDGQRVMARGHLSAAVTQACVVTATPLPAKIEEDFEIHFLPEGQASDDEVELTEAECDTVFYTGGAIDLGEAAAETLALSLDPFPRSPDAAAILAKAGIVSEEEAEQEPPAPNNALAGLKDLLGKKG